VSCAGAAIIQRATDGNSVYVVNWFPNEVWAIDADTLAVMAKMPVGGGPPAFGAFLHETL
jgi:YVTN family beta-propeller protein